MKRRKLLEKLTPVAPPWPRPNRLEITLSHGPVVCAVCHARFNITPNGYETPLIVFVPYKPNRQSNRFDVANKLKHIVFYYYCYYYKCPLPSLSIIRNLYVSFYLPLYLIAFRVRKHTRRKRLRFHITLVQGHLFVWR